MQTITLLAILPLLFGLPEPKVVWSKTDEKAVDVSVEGRDTLFTTCLKSGFGLRYRFEVKLCRVRSLWFDSCADERVEHHTLTYEPISSSYTLQSDRLGDEIQPQTLTLSSSEEAAGALRNVRRLSLDFLAGGDGRLLEDRPKYLAVRVLSNCRGSHNETLAKISAFLSMGLVRVSGFDTGWHDFRLDSAAAIRAED